MTQISTDLRQTIETAKRIRYESTTIAATNVQDAIDRAGSSSTPTPTPVTPAMSPYAPVPTDQLLLVDTSGDPVVIAMPASATRTLGLEIKDSTGHAFANPITVTFTGGQSADGLSPYLINGDYGAARLSPKTGGYFVNA